MKVKSKSEVTRSCPTLSDSMGFSRQEYWSRVPVPSLFLMLLEIIALMFSNVLKLKQPVLTTQILLIDYNCLDMYYENL